VDTAPGSVRQRSRAQFVYMIIAIHVYVRYGISMPATPRTSSREDYRTPRACYRKAPVRRETAEERAQRQTGQLPAQMQALKEAERAVQVLRIAERKGDSRATVLRAPTRTPLRSTLIAPSRTRASWRATGHELFLPEA
jgi:hypothetical protein